MIWKDGVERPDAIEVNEIIKKYVDIFQKNGKLLDENKLAIGSGGNMSVKVPGGILITSSGSKFPELKAEDVVFVFAIYSKKVYYVGSKKPSSETIMHWMIYLKRPEINAISHVNVGPKDEKNILTSAKEIDWGTEALGIDTAELMKKSDIVMMKNHGVIAVGQDLTDATQKIIDGADNKKPFIFT